MTAEPVARYRHPQGATITIFADGSMQALDANGKRKNTSATPEKLAAGHGQWVREEDFGGVVDLAQEVSRNIEAVETASLRIFEPQLLEHITIEEMGRYVTDDRWVAEQKFDGVRMCVRITPGRVEFLTRGGRPLTHAASALCFPRLRAHLSLIPADARGELILDGELMPSTCTYWVFDEVRAVDGDEVLLDDTYPFQTRRRALEGFFAARAEAGFDDPCMQLVPQAVGFQQKAAMCEQVFMQVAEGVVFKQLDAPYDARGGRVSHTVKAKFERTYDLVVIDRNRGTSVNVNGESGTTLNAILGYWDPTAGRFVEAGACSMIGKPDAQVGDVVEIKCLYWTGSSVYQPTLLRIRDDRLPTECTLDQFQTVSKEVAWTP